jgi:hypothetical protein
VVFNGHVYPQATKVSMDSEYEQAPLVMRRAGGRFEVVKDPGPGLLGAHRDRTAVFSDLDGDGDVDMVVGELNGPLRLLRNMHDRADDWVTVRLKGPAGGLGHGMGAVVELASAKDPVRVLARRWVWAGGPFQSTACTDLSFGAPAEWGPLVATVRWPAQGDGGAMVSPPAEVRRGAVAEIARPPVRAPQR